MGKKNKGLDGWIEIFADGRQTDSSGRIHDGGEMIERAIASFDRAKYRPPIVIGHPKSNSPAFGWVKDLRKKVKDGRNILEVKFHKMSDGFKKAVQSGHFEQRSASFFSDGRLRHVGFLGAAPPAVEGLEEIEFGDSGEFFEFEFADNDNQISGEEKQMDIKEFFDGMRAFFSFKKELDEKPQAPPQAQPAGTTANFSQADLDKAIADAKAAGVAEGKTAATADFTAKTAEQQKSARLEAAKAKLKSLVDEKKLPPALAGEATLDFMAALSDASEITFSADQGDTPDQPLEYFVDFLSALPVHGVFTSVATKTTAGKTAEFTAQNADMTLAEEIAACVNLPKE